MDLDYIFNNITNSTVSPIGNSTGVPNDDEPIYPQYLGFITASVTVLFFGSNFVPVKKYETGDGMFFQWILCSAILIVGLIFQIIRPAPFYPLCAVGGMFWATGNICAVPIIKTIGLGLGICIWATSQLITGWATGTFGLFGTPKAQLANVAMNYAGVAISASSGFIYIFVKSEVSSKNSEVIADPPTELQSLNSEKEDLTFFDKLSPRGKYITGVVLSLISGFLYGNMFTPSLHIQHNYPGASQDSLDYAFSQFCGIYISSSFYFVVYCAFMKNNPRVYPKVILPGLVSGTMWGIATGCWFIANIALQSEAVSFPIVSTCPPIIACLFWGCFVFKEIKGKKNIAVLLLGCSLSVIGSVLAGVSAG